MDDFWLVFGVVLACFVMAIFIPLDYIDIIILEPKNISSVKHPLLIPLTNRAQPLRLKCYMTQCEIGKKKVYYRQR